MRLLVTGCGRSGTTWVAAALRATGIDCGHERAFTVEGLDRPEGRGEGEWVAEVSGHAAPFTPIVQRNPGVYVVHLVRDPRRVIASLLNRSGTPGLGARPATRRFVRMVLPELTWIEDDRERAAVYWVRWNRLVRSDEILRLEDVGADDVLRLARLVDPDARPAAFPPVLNASRPARRRTVTWDDLRGFTDLLELATEYGYRVG